jgi:uncharacterized protein YdhG (YjbR/CyaY superfamily)
MQSRAATVAEYLASLPDDRRRAIEAVRQTLLKHLAPGFQETMQYGMIGYSVPHAIYPAGYHCDPKQPLPFAGLASQKGHMSLYLFCVYADEATRLAFIDAWNAEAAKGKAGRLDMGKGCIRFRKLEDVPLAVVGEAIKKVTVKKFIEQYESVIATNQRAAAARKAARATAKTPAKTPAPKGAKPAPRTAKTGAKKAPQRSTSAAPRKSAAKAATKGTTRKTSKRRPPE